MVLQYKTFHYVKKMFHLFLQVLVVFIVPMMKLRSNFSIVDLKNNQKLMMNQLVFNVMRGYTPEEKHLAIFEEWRFLKDIP